MINRPRDTATCSVHLISDGPALVRGAGTIRDTNGVDHLITRPVVAICVCGLSQRAPWCDGTHKVAPLARRARERGSAASDQEQPGSDPEQPGPTPHGATP